MLRVECCEGGRDITSEQVVRKIATLRSATQLEDIKKKTAVHVSEMGQGADGVGDITGELIVLEAKKRKCAQWRNERGGTSEAVIIKITACEIRLPYCDSYRLSRTAPSGRRGGRYYLGRFR